jgi:YD repeat-containing protein
VDNANPDFRDYLPNALITDYFYKRFGGICSIINPNGQETGYTYDVFNQLKSIVDQDGNLLELYRYNYKNN